MIDIFGFVITTDILLVILLTGVLPSILWFFFWLREDRFQPEPRGLLILTFIAGALSVFMVLPLGSLVDNLGFEGTERLLIFAGIEELIKFSVVYFVDFNSSYLDEPIDYAIYLISGSLGFAMMENVLFLLSPALQSDISFIVYNSMLRFLGATILHATLAATLGLILGFVFYKSKATKRLYLVLGLVVVTILHTIFNYFIIKYVELDGLVTLGILWVITIIIINLFEKVRRITH